MASHVSSPALGAAQVVIGSKSSVRGRWLATSAMKVSADLRKHVTILSAAEAVPGRNNDFNCKSIKFSIRIVRHQSGDLSNS